MRYARIENGIVAQITGHDVKKYSPSLAAKYIPCGEEVTEGMVFRDGKFSLPEDAKVSEEAVKAMVTAAVLETMAMEYLGIVDPIAQDDRKEIRESFAKVVKDKDPKDKEKLAKLVSEKIKRRKANGK